MNYDDLEIVKKLKENALKNNQYELAANFRESEKLIEKQISIMWTEYQMKRWAAMNFLNEIPSAGDNA